MEDNPIAGGPFIQHRDFEGACWVASYISWRYQIPGKYRPLHQDLWIYPARRALAGVPGRCQEGTTSISCRRADNRWDCRTRGSKRLSGEFRDTNRGSNVLYGHVHGCLASDMFPLSATILLVTPLGSLLEDIFSSGVRGHVQCSSDQTLRKWLSMEKGMQGRV